MLFQIGHGPTKVNYWKLLEMSC